MSRVELDYKGLRYHTHTEVYAPHDDTWLLVDAVRSLGPLVGRRVVEVGCGAGLGLIQAACQGAKGVGVDRNGTALTLTRENARLNGVADRVGLVHGDLLTAIDIGGVDLVLFNPPYLPTVPEERLPGDLNLAFDGGPTGNETLFRFIDALADAVVVAGSRLDGAGQGGPDLVLVTSSLNDRAALRGRLREAGWGEVSELGTVAFPFERLFVERFTRR